MPDTPLLHVKRETVEPRGVILACLYFNPHDCWIGIYWKRVVCEWCQREHLQVWITLVPCFPLFIVFGG